MKRENEVLSQSSTDTGNAAWERQQVITHSDPGTQNQRPPPRGLLLASCSRRKDGAGDGKAMGRRWEGAAEGEKEMQEREMRTAVAASVMAQ